MDSINLNMGISDGDTTTNVNITAENPYDLARILKNAGIAGNSKAFNQPATLASSSMVDGGTIQTTTSAQELRSIMNLLTDKFQVCESFEGDEEENEHSHGSDYDYRSHDVNDEEYPGKGSRDNANPELRYVPARYSDNPLKKSLKEYMKDIQTSRIVENECAPACLIGGLGEVSLQDITDGHRLFHDILGDDTTGITVIELDTPGKNEHNFVKGINSSYKVGNHVPFQIQSNGVSSNINGKIVLVITGSQLVNDRNEVEQRLASAGIQSHVKLPVKSF
jgi:hypothetical protein